MINVSIDKEYDEIEIGNDDVSLSLDVNEAKYLQDKLDKFLEEYI